MEKIIQFAFDNILNGIQYTIEEKIEIMKQCLQSGANINNNPVFVLNLAINFRQHSAVEFLIENGINFRIDNDILLITACQKDDYEMIKILLDAGCEANALNNRAIWLYSGKKIDFKIIKLLIERGADPFSHDNNLFYNACKGHNMEIIRYLISIGANVSVPDNRPILELFKRKRSLEIKRLLLECGACSNTSSESESLLERAFIIGNYDDCKLLFEFNATLGVDSILYNKKKFGWNFNMNIDTLRKMSELFMANGCNIDETIDYIIGYKQKEASGELYF